MTCSACQTLLDPTDAFCRRCGAPTSDNARPRARHVDRGAYADPGPPPRTPPSLFMGAVEPTGTFLLLFGGIFAFVGTLLGAIFTVVGFASGEVVFRFVGPAVLAVFGGIGYACLGFGIQRIRRARRVWRDGEVREAKVVDVFRDRSVRVNGRSPLGIRYEYEVFGQKFTGQGQSWHDGWRDLPQDARVAVIVDRDEPARSLLHLPAK